MNERISNFFENLRNRRRTNKRYRRLVGSFGKESLEDRFERYDFDHKERKLEQLQRQIAFKVADLESHRRLRSEITVDNLSTANPALVSRINRLDNKIRELEDEIRDLNIIYEDERRKLDNLRNIVRGPKENRVDQSFNSEIQEMNQRVNEAVESLSVEETPQTQAVEQTTGVQINNQEGTQVSVNEGSTRESGRYTLPPATDIEPSAPTTINQGQPTQAVVSQPTGQIQTSRASVQIPNTQQNANDPDYLKLIASDKMSEFARGYRMVKREERRSRTCKFLNEITTATGFGMMSLSAYFMYGLAAYDAPNGPIQFWETIGTDVVQKISSDPSFSNVMDALGHGPAQLLVGAVFLGVGLKGYLKYRKQFKEANAKRVDMEDLNAVTEAPITEHIARHI